MFTAANTRDAVQTEAATERIAIMVLASTYDQSKYYRAEDIQKEKLLKIKGVTEEKVGQGANQEEKLVVWFNNTKKGLALNRTNNRTIRGAYGDDTAGWVGKLIVVFQTMGDFRGRSVPCVRVRIPTKDDGKPKREPDTLDDLPEDSIEDALGADDVEL
jgi:hypothetical protein